MDTGINTLTVTLNLKAIEMETDLSITTAKAQRAFELQLGQWNKNETNLKTREQNKY